MTQMQLLQCLPYSTWSVQVSRGSTKHEAAATQRTWLHFAKQWQDLKGPGVLLENWLHIALLRTTALLAMQESLAVEMLTTFCHCVESIMCVVHDMQGWHGCGHTQLCLTLIRAFRCCCWQSTLQDAGWFRVGSYPAVVESITWFLIDFVCCILACCMWIALETGDITGKDALSQWLLPVLPSADQGRSVVLLTQLKDTNKDKWTTIGDFWQQSYWQQLNWGSDTTFCLRTGTVADHRNQLICCRAFYCTYCNNLLSGSLGCCGWIHDACRCRAVTSSSYPPIFQSRFCSWYKEMITDNIQ